MKKLLVAAIGAAAAIGAFADTPTPITALRFEAASFEAGQTNTVSDLNTKHGGTYWSDTGFADNAYVIEAANPEGDSCPLPQGDNPTKALNVKTKFGNPLSVNVNAGGTVQEIDADGVYFDSLVKFTVCDGCPTNEYEGAKIVMWLQEDEDLHKTNLYVNAGYLTYDGGVQVSNAIYKCGNTIESDFADKWHRVTIKAIANITTSTSTAVPGFAIFIDGSGQEATRANSNDAKWDSTFTDQFTFVEAVEELRGAKALFPSLDQSSGNKLTMTKASFDGTGSITDIAFYDASPDTFADDYVAPKASVQIGEGEPVDVDSLADAVAAVVDAGLQEGDVATIRLIAGITLDTPIVIPDSIEADLVLDFAGFVITNTIADAIITNNAPALIIKNEAAAKGGIYCEDYQSELVDHVALYQNGGLAIQGGYFWGYINESESQYVSTTVTGGSFLEKAFVLPQGKVWDDADEDGLYAVIDYVAPTYTITVEGGEHFAVAVTTNTVAAGAAGAYVVTEGDSVAVTYTADTGYTLSKYGDGIASVSATATIAAPVATLQTFNVIFVDGDSATTNVVNYGTTLTAESAPAFVGRTGYTAAWDKTVAGTTVTAETTFTAVYTAIEYTITYKTAEGEAFTSWADQYDAPDSFTVENPATLPAAANVALALGVTFNGWTNAVGTAVTTTEGLTANLVVFANVTVPGPSEPTIDPASSTTVEVTASTKQDAINAVAIAAPAAAGIDTAEEKAAYKALFDIDATNKGGDTWDVEIKDIKEQVKIDVAETAEAIVSGTAETGTVTVPKGLYYKVTTYETLGGTPTVAVQTTLSTGTASKSIAKPGEAQGFIKVEMATTAAELAD